MTKFNFDSNCLLHAGNYTLPYIKYLHLHFRDFPTKLDCDVYNALSYSECKLDRDRHPNVYRWHHNISLYPLSERER